MGAGWTAAGRYHTLSGRATRETGRDEDRRSRRHPPDPPAAPGGGSSRRGDPPRPLRGGAPARPADLLLDPLHPHPLELLGAGGLSPLAPHPRAPALAAGDAGARRRAPRRP